MIIQKLFSDTDSFDTRIAQCIHTYEREHKDVLPSTIDYAKMEFGRGMAYAQNYIKRLHFKGDHVLDAGCGVGNWTLALGLYFKNVTALEYSEDRLRFSKYIFEKLNIPSIKPIHGSIESLPFEDESFDAVFCNGVIFLTDYKTALREFFRVLKPGGSLYVGYDGLAWWDHLIFDRGKTNPTMYPMACHMLLGCVKDQIPLFLNENTPIKRLIVSFLLLVLSFKNTSFFKDTPLKIKSFLCFLKCLTFKKINFAEFLINKSLKSTLFKIKTAFSRIFEYGTFHQKKELITYIEDYLQNPLKEHPVVRGTSLDIDDMERDLHHIGFTHVLSTHEGHLLSPPIKLKSIYEPSMGVYESLAQKPHLPVDVFFDNALKESLLSFKSLEKVAFNIKENNSLDILLSKYLSCDSFVHSQEKILKNFLKTLLNDQNSEEERFFNLYSYLQDRFFHHPTFQFMENKTSIAKEPLLLMMTGIGRCGAVAHVCSVLFSLLGYKTRVTQLFRHLCCEVLVGDRWCIVDADVFKGGLFPKNKDGEWATLEEMKENPYLLDCIPSIGLQLSPKASFSQSFDGSPIEGYVDTGLSWDRPYLSYFYFGGEDRHPCFPPSCVIHTESDGSKELVFHNIDPSTDSLEIHISTDPRGWSYEERPGAHFLKTPSHVIASYAIFKEDILHGKAHLKLINVVFDPQNYYLQVYAKNNYAMKYPIFVWPFDEIKFKG